MAAVEEEEGEGQQEKAHDESKQQLRRSGSITKEEEEEAHDKAAKLLEDGLITEEEYSQILKGTTLFAKEEHMEEEDILTADVAKACRTKGDKPARLVIRLEDIKGVNGTVDDVPVVEFRIGGHQLVSNPPISTSKGEEKEGTIDAEYAHDNLYVWSDKQVQSATSIDVHVFMTENLGFTTRSFGCCSIPLGFLEEEKVTEKMFALRPKPGSGYPNATGEVHLSLCLLESHLDDEDTGPNSLVVSVVRARNLPGADSGDHDYYATLQLRTPSLPAAAGGSPKRAKVVDGQVGCDWANPEKSHRRELTHPPTDLFAITTDIRENQRKMRSPRTLHLSLQQRGCGAHDDADGTRHAKL